MCGITGFIDKKNKLKGAAKKKIISKMLKAIDHRGGDGRGIYVDGALAMAHARLSIVDLSNNATQPMKSRSGNTILSFNGEIYNHREIRNTELRDYQFQSTSDTETLLYGFEKLGEKIINRLRGMFAFSFFDRVNNKVFLAIDHCGIKPLYYLSNDDWFAWSSEIKGLLVLPNLNTKLNKPLLGEYLLFRSNAGDETLFRGIKKMLPEQQLTVDLNNFKERLSICRRPSHPSFNPSLRVEQLTVLLEQSVKEHLMADVPLGLQLSGGIDSSLIAALVRKNLGMTELLHSFSIGLSDSSWNEFIYSRIVKEKLGTVHHEIIFTEKDFCLALPEAIYHYDQPINHSHSIPMMLLAREARKHVKILLSGEGADEVFGGYLRYQQFAERRNRVDKNIIFSNAFEELARVKKLLKKDNLDLSWRHAIVDEVRHKSFSYRLGWYDFKTYLTPMLLRQDTMGMASSLENRVPFLDQRLVAFGLNLKLSEKISAGETKFILKKAAEAFLPKEIVFRKKIGFSQPLSFWLKNPNGLGRYLKLFSRKNFRRDFLCYEEVEGLISNHLANRADNGNILWELINLELWLRIFIDQESYQSFLFL